MRINVSIFQVNVQHKQRRTKLNAYVENAFSFSSSHYRMSPRGMMWLWVAKPTCRPVEEIIRYLIWSTVQKLKALTWRDGRNPDWLRGANQNGNHNGRENFLKRTNIHIIVIFCWFLKLCFYSCLFDSIFFTIYSFFYAFESYVRVQHATTSLPFDFPYPLSRKYNPLFSLGF